MVDLLLSRENITESDSVWLKDRLSILSYTAQDQGLGTSFRESFVMRYFDDRLEMMKLAFDAHILVRDANDEIKFVHQLMQEYFAAVRLQQEINQGLNADKIWAQDSWWEASVWDETVIFMCGLVDDLHTIIDWLKDSNPSLTFRLLTELDKPVTEQYQSELATRWLSGLVDLQRYPHPAGRAALGRVLGYLTWDTRYGVNLDKRELPQVDWVEIPAGKFLYQKDEYHDLPTFYISRYPVTYAQYEAFVRDGGYSVDRFWTQAGRDWRDTSGGALGRNEHPLFGWEDSFWHIANHPVVGITWYEALAFCAWLSEKLQYQISLPDEYQWEKAARGVKGLLYPYGNKLDPRKCNLEETGIGRTSPVGIFPNGVSVYGVADMCGNVWEWCINNYDKPLDNDTEVPDALKDSVQRTLRGSSWYLERGGGKVTARFRFFQSDYDDYTGFRLICHQPQDSE